MKSSAVESVPIAPSVCAAASTGCFLALGQQLTLPLYHDRLVGFVGTTEVVELPRWHVHGSTAMRRARCINYRQVMGRLRH
ncbi:hypothetical protein [Stenomitos frigidus]|uniref:hypothetical protein n=1 Tax=Stenomitos frigidus TaxID=1886765 RepID=UPI0015E6D91F